MGNAKDVSINAALGNMSRQYVGARYVPKFFQNPNGTAEWLGNVPYEPLTIVTYLGNSYTSKVPVPAGVGNPSLNPTYWALTGNFNAQLDQINTELGNIEGDIASQQADITNLQNYVNSQDRYYLLLADSYGDNANGWTKVLPPLLGWSDDMYSIAQKGGAGFVEAGQGETFLTLFNAVSSDIKNKVTDVILITAGNDLRVSITTSQVSGAIGTLVATIKNTCSKLKGIHMGACIARRNPAVHKSGLIRVLNDINGMSKCHFMVSSPCFVHSSYYLQSDNVHLSADGYRLIAYGIMQYLAGNEFYNDIVAQEASYGNVVVETKHLYGRIKVWIHGSIDAIEASTEKILISTLSNTDLLGGDSTHLGVGAIGNPLVVNRPVEITMEGNQLFIKSIAGYLPVSETPVNVFANFDVSAYEF